MLIEHLWTMRQTKKGATEFIQGRQQTTRLETQTDKKTICQPPKQFVTKPADEHVKLDLQSQTNEYKQNFEGKKNECPGYHRSTETKRFAP